MTKRDLIVVAAALTLFVALVASCTAAEVAQDVVADVALGKELPCGPSVTADGSREPVLMPDGSLVDQAEIDALLTGPPSTAFDPSKPVMLPDDRNFPLVLGAAWPLDVTKVTPEESSPGQCHFEVTLSEAGLNAMNRVAALCFERTAQCPTGQLAIIADGRVISAPTIQSRSFDQPEFVVSSPVGATPDESLELTALIANAAQFRPVIFDPATL